MTIDKLAFSTSEAADSIGVGARLLAQWRQDGTGPPCFKQGARFFYPSQELQRWLSDRCGMSTAGRQIEADADVERVNQLRAMADRIGELTRSTDPGDYDELVELLAQIDD